MALGWDLSRSSMNETGYQCAVHEKGGASVGGPEAGREEGEEGEDCGGAGEEEGGAVAAAAFTEAEEEVAAAAAAAVAVPLGVAQTTFLLLLCGRSCRAPRGQLLGARVRWMWPRRVAAVKVDDVGAVAIVVVAAIAAPWRREWAAMAVVCTAAV